jgi:alkylation response protein AidB-like acyl-CoA dehydrogenase
MVFAVTDQEVQRFRGVSCFLVDCDNDGLERGAPFEKMGLSTLKNGELVFEGCRVPSNRIVGAEGQGAIMMQETLEWERILFSAVHLGVLERTMRRCLVYVKQREAFGKPIGHYQSIANKIVEMKQHLELGELILYRSACLKDLGKRAPVETSICKLHVSRSLKSACLHAVQIHGAYGYMRENPVERDLRDAVAATIYSGTTELQQNIIAKMMGI